MLVVSVGGLNIIFVMKFSLCVTSILKVTRMLEEFHLYELSGGAASHERYVVSLKKVQEWIKHMAIKVLSKKNNFDTRVVSGSVYCYRFHFKK